LHGIPLLPASLFEKHSGREAAKQCRRDEKRDYQGAAADTRPRDDRGANRSCGQGTVG
jgi:hypothetical protein